MHDGDKENRKTVSSADGCCKQPQYAQEQHVGGGANVTTGGRESSRSLPLSPLRSVPLPVVLPSLLNYASGPAPVDPAPIDNALGDVRPDAGTTAAPETQAATLGSPRL